MSKRIRDDGAPIPAWLAKSGVDAHALRQLLSWMTQQRLCFVDSRGIHGGHGAAHHALDPVVTAHRGDMVLLCERCSPHCECCDAVVPNLYETTSADNPHDEACLYCHEDKKCAHTDEYDCWPEYCEGCERGCREQPEEKTMGGKEVVICERCHSEFYE